MRPIYVIYPGPAARMYVPEADLLAERGHRVRVAADLGHRLVAQGWHESSDPHDDDVVTPDNPDEPGDRAEEE